ncbi:hypothetical protein F66182_14889 [Fusarium sp. NRRL 66182]|nr:hypothetical protein F66182_14889 [Fusarium sp. NRRL 66182]
MPGKTLPSFTEAEVRSHNSSKSCYVTIDSKVYDVTDFLEGHPAGEEVILEWAGKDIKNILKDGSSHEHSDSAYDILDEYHIGFLSNVASKAKSSQANGDSQAIYEKTGMANEEDLSIETDIASDYKTHKFLDLSKPLFPQIWFGGFSKEFYLDQVHRPRHYKGGESAPLFGNFLEPLSKTPWYVIPILWVPCVAYGTTIGAAGLNNPTASVGFFVLGLFVWTLLEYGMHRFLFHIDKWLPDNRVGITAHFLLHGIHHYLPMDKYRLVMPPTLFVALALPFWKVAHTILYFNWYAGLLGYCGGVAGYIMYDMTHYFLHHRK